MKRNLSASVIFLVFLQVLAGCSSDWGFGFTAGILSDQPSDGDIGFLSGIYTVTHGSSTDTLFFGIDSGSTEYRAFLSFPLNVIPLNADINSATLTVRIKSMGYAATVPTLLELVSYVPGALVQGNYTDPPLTFSNGYAASRTFNLYYGDVGNDVEIDVTSLMREAQARGLSDFQVRFSLNGVSGLVGIEDDPLVAVTAPFLTVRYF